MEQGSPQLLLNCPKCNSGRLQFVRNTPDEVYLKCMDCEHRKDGVWVTLNDAAAAWNER